MRRKALTDKKFQLERALMDEEAYDSMKGAQIHLSGL